jgi:uncharacterized membrane protein (UPF0127 family)
MRARLLAAGLGAAIAVSCGADDPARPDPPDAPRTIPVTIGTHVVHAEIASTLGERSVGLMGRTSLPDTAGMLFIFGSDTELSFWMKDTPIDLDIAFLDSTRTILNIEGMTALDQSTFHRSNGPARYALEVRRGWFAARGIAAGTKLQFTVPSGIVIDP